MNGNDDSVETNAPRLARRPRVKKPDDELKAYRDRLTHGTENKPEFEYELLTMFARNETGAPYAMPAFCFIFAIASVFWASWIEALGWFASVSLGKYWLFVACRRLLATPRANVNVGEWKKRFFIIETVNVIALAGFALVGISQGYTTAPEATFSSHVFVFATLMIIIALRMTFASTIIRVFVVGTLPMTIAVAVRLVWVVNPFYFALAIMAVGIHVFFLYLTQGLHSTALSMVEFRAEKDGLIAELEEATSISDESRRRAEAANLAKSRFLATMSHELRTPLNAIMGFSEVMEKELLGPIGNGTYKEYALNIYSSGNHLLHIINEILDLSRIEAGRYDLNEETIRLADIAEDCQRLVKIRADAKGLIIIEDFAPDLPQVWADPRAMRQICLNLLSNALKFTPKGGRITITITKIGKAHV